MEDKEQRDARGAGGGVFQKWGVREVVSAVLLSALLLLVMFVGASLTVVSYDFAMVASGAVGVFLAAPIFMLMVARVDRCGVTTVFATLAGLLFGTMGNTLYMIPWYILSGIVLDLVFFSSERHRKNPWWASGAWSAFSGLYLLSTLLVFIGNVQGYIDKLMANQGVDQLYVDTFMHYYTNPVWIIAIFVITVAAGFLGSLVGRTLMRRHFSKAGAL